MKSESGIKNRWELLESVTGIVNLRHRFDAYGWSKNIPYLISKDEHWCGWWNDCFDFVSIWAKPELISKIKNAFEEMGWSTRPIINGGISIHYETMTKKESDEKAYQNLIHGGRMSD